MKKRFSLLMGSALLASVITSCNNQTKTTESTTTNTETTVAKASETPLGSWNDGAAKDTIMNFIKKTTTEGSKDFVPEADRIAVFDNDGTLWSEQPMYFQLAFMLDRVKEMSVNHPEWKTKEPFKSVIEGDLKKVLSGGKPALMALVAATHSNISAEDFEKSVKTWMSTATHPKTGLHYNEMIFQPMLDVLSYLRENKYKTFIVSGGGVDFMRAWAPEAYGIPTEQIIGSSLKATYSVDKDGNPQITKVPDLNFYDDKAEKPVGIYQNIGKRPIIAFGNSDGDYEMLQWTTTGKGYPRLGVYIHHTDDAREVAYDRESHIGTLAKGLDDAPKYGWLVVDMKKDWKSIYPQKK
ncbi:HAD family hydrolase [Pedobacter sp. MW01-1-1]|uniref:HAD family hydrolase n=1 Tax=Pedobacter sp. MW01-1-1 TaxID=3383027 RepID=UPI003FEFAE39